MLGPQKTGIIMSELIAFEVYRTIAIKFNEEDVVIRLSKRKDFDEYALFAENKNGTKRWHCSYPLEMAVDLNKSTEQELNIKISSIIQECIDARPHLKS